MSEKEEINLNSLHVAVQREFENDTVQEVDPFFYTSISEFASKLKEQQYADTEAKIKAKLVEMFSDLTAILINIRFNKAKNSVPINYTNLLDEEKYILDSEDEMRDKQEMFISAILDGRSNVLESLSQKHKTKTSTVRFLKEFDELVGVDFKKYGPFKAQEVATIPFENAQGLLAQNIAVKVKTDD